MANLLGIRAYARRRGVSHTAVQKAVNSGRLKDSVCRDRQGQIRIDADVADREWGDNTDKAQQRERRGDGGSTRSERDNAESGSQLRTARRPPLVAPPPEPMAGASPTGLGAPAGAVGPAGDAGPLPTSGPSFNQSRAVREAYRAKTERVRYELLVGSVVRADEVRSQAFRVHRVVRDALLNIPHRIAAELAATTSVHLVHQILIRELNGALAELVDEGRRN
jgi:hypothetical protein